MSKISYIIESTINHGKVDEFRTKAEGCIEAVEGSEPDTLGYQWYLSEDGTRCLQQETFSASEAMLTHLSNFGPSIPELLAIAPTTRLEVLGSASAAAVDALAALGAVHFPSMGGFDR